MLKKFQVQKFLLTVWSILWSKGYSVPLLTPVIPTPFWPKLEVIQAQLKEKMTIKKLERNKETELEHIRTKEDMNLQIPSFTGNSE